MLRHLNHARLLRQIYRETDPGRPERYEPTRTVRMSAVIRGVTHSLQARRAAHLFDQLMRRKP